MYVSTCVCRKSWILILLTRYSGNEPVSQENEARTVPIVAWFFFVKDFAFVDRSSSELTSIVMTMDSMLDKVQSLKDNIEGLRDKM